PVRVRPLTTAVGTAVAAYGDPGRGHVADHHPLRALVRTGVCHRSGAGRTAGLDGSARPEIPLEGIQFVLVSHAGCRLPCPRAVPRHVTPGPFRTHGLVTHA